MGGQLAVLEGKFYPAQNCFEVVVVSEIRYLP